MKSEWNGHLKNTDSFQASRGFLNPVNKTRLEYHSEQTGLSVELWRKMTDTDPDCVPVKNDSLGQKEKEGLKWKVDKTKSISWNVATDNINTAKSGGSFRKEIPAVLLSLKIKNRLEFSIYQHAVRK